VYQLALSLNCNQTAIWRQFSLLHAVVPAVIRY